MSLDKWHGAEGKSDVGMGERVGVLVYVGGVVLVSGAEGGQVGVVHVRQGCADALN